MKVIIAGGRELRLSADEIQKYVDLSGIKITEVVSGGASGVDTSGENWAAINGVQVKRFPADWNKHGKAAGPIRNRQMTTYADALIALSTGGPGTENMIHEAMKMHLMVFAFEVKP